MIKADSESLGETAQFVRLQASDKMNSNHPSRHPNMFTIVLHGKNPKLQKIVKSEILSNGNVSDKTSNDSFRIISIDDFFNEKCPDQQMNDKANHSSGVNLFILAIDSQNAQMDKVDSEIVKLQDIFGKNVTRHLVVVVENYSSYQSLSQLKEMFPIKLVTLSEHLADNCKKWCPEHWYNNNKDCCKEDMERSKKDLKRNEDHRKRSGHRSHSLRGRGSSMGGQGDDPIFNIVLLGQTGTGKSASGNTILTAVDPKLDPSQLFESRPSSSPVTSKCEVKEIKVFGRQVRVVDTPDFLDEDVDSQAHVDECKKYCQKGNCVVLLVIQMGRFTDGEKGILERLEKKLGWGIREKTVVLLTHGEKAKGQEQSFIAERTYLDSMVRACGDRNHVFQNTSKNSKQVMELFKKFPDFETPFSQLPERPRFCECSVS